MKKFLLSAFLSALGLLCPSTLRGQDLGNVGLRTVQSTLATNQSCAASPFTFTTGVTAGFNNLGQTQHTISLIGNGTLTTLTAEIDGIDNAGNVYRISDVLRLPAFFGLNAGSLTGYGYFPQIRIAISCTPVGGTFTLNYSGSMGQTVPSVGSYQAAQINKVVFKGISGGSSVNDTVQTPFGSSAGILEFTINTTLPANSSLSVNCQGVDGTAWATYTFTPDVTLGGFYSYPIPGNSCPFLAFLYTSGGATANTFSVSFLFNASGTLTGGYMYNATQLNASAMVEPAAGTSVLTQVIDTRGVKNATFSYTCTAGAFSVNVQEYKQDSVVATTQLVTPVTAIVAGTQGSLYIGGESNPATDTGTLAAPPAGVVRFPQRALAFSFTNAGGAGTCNARLFVTY